MRIDTIYTLRQPLSHIGESEGTTTFLNTVRIATPDGIAEVFAYTGNAIRGTLRDCAARHLLKTLNIKVPKKEFNILFSGGNISGAMKVDVGQAAKYRELLPMISLFGAGIGNQILAGKMVQGFAFPVCRETAHLLPDIPGTDELRATSWKTMTGTVSFTRMDDEKDVNLQQYIAGDGTPEKKDGEASTQMRYEVEYLVPGSRLYHEMTLQDVSEVELGVFVTAVCEFAQSPVLGGMSGKGFGLCDVEMDIGNGHISICNKECAVTDGLAGAANAYSAHIKDHAEEIIALLGGVAL